MGVSQVIVGAALHPQDSDDIHEYGAVPEAGAEYELAERAIDASNPWRGLCNGECLVADGDRAGSGRRSGIRCEITAIGENLPFPRSKQAVSQTSLEVAVQAQGVIIRC